MKVSQCTFSLRNIRVSAGWCIVFVSLALLTWFLPQAVTQTLCACYVQTVLSWILFICFVSSSCFPIWTCVSPSWMRRALQPSESESSTLNLLGTRLTYLYMQVSVCAHLSLSFCLCGCVYVRACVFVYAQAVVAEKFATMIKIHVWFFFCVVNASVCMFCFMFVQGLVFVDWLEKGFYIYIYIYERF